MLARTRSGAVYGVDAHPVEVEVHLTSGGNGDFDIVGLPDAAIREARSRIRAALRNSAFEVPHERIVVNLAPAGLRKEGASFDLPMAIGILACAGALETNPEHVLLVGELALDGRLRPVRGALSLAMLARKAGIRNVVVPLGNAAEAALAAGVRVFGFPNLTDVVAFLDGKLSARPAPRRHPDTHDGTPVAEDFKDVRGQPAARRALEVAIAGGHNILMIGPPGSGKTMLARRIPSIMPEMSEADSVEATRVHSAAGLLQGGGIVSRRPFRAPHHSVSSAGLVGGGPVPRPGELSLAHNGVLFLDELPEFSRHTLEALRQPLEEGCVTIARAQMTLTFPAAFVLVAAMNPCRCGYHGDPHRECSCTPKQIEAYMSRISGPLLDRIDIQIEVPAVPYRHISAPRDSESSAGIRPRVVHARGTQLQRFEGTATRTNSGMSPAQLKAWCALDAASEDLLEQSISRLGLSARGWSRILKVARTIADLAGNADIHAPHVAEAIRYRRLDVRGAGAGWQDAPTTGS